MQHLLSEKQSQVLNYLLSHPDGVTVEKLVLHLGVTTTAVKQYLVKLIDLALIESRDEKGLIGRPQKKYFLTPSGHESFPRQYTWLSSQLLILLTSSLGKDSLSKIFSQLAKQVYKSVESEISDEDKSYRISKMLKVLNGLGYRMKQKKTEKNGIVILEALNCVYHEVAQAHPEVCQFDINFITEASKMSVSLESCIARGGASCRFCLK